MVYSRDGADGTGRDLWVLEPASGRARPLREAAGDQWDPCWSADGGTVYHASDEHGTRDLMALSVNLEAATTKEEPGAEMRSQLSDFVEVFPEFHKEPLLEDLNVLLTQLD